MVEPCRKANEIPRKCEQTAKAVAMVADGITDCAARGDIVVVAFLGCATRLIDAEQAGGLSFTEKEELAHG